MKLRESFPDDIRHIVFDLGNVLVDLDIRATLNAFAALRIGGLAPEDIHPHQSGFFLDYELGLISDETFTARLRQRYDCAGVTDDQIWTAWNAMIPAIEVQRFEWIEALRRKYRVYVLSNTNTRHIDHVRKLFAEATDGMIFDRCFDGTFYSHQMHLRKPDPDIYRRVIAETDAIPAEILFIDDNLCNIPPAVALHLKTHHLTANESLSDLFV